MPTERTLIDAQSNMILAVEMLEEKTWSQARLPVGPTDTTEMFLGRFYPTHIYKIRNPNIEPFYSLIRVGNLEVPGNPPPYSPRMAIPLSAPDITTVIAGEVSIINKIGLLNRRLLVQMGIFSDEISTNCLQEICGVETKSNTPHIAKIVDDSIIHFDAIGEGRREIESVEKALLKFSYSLVNQFGIVLLPYGPADLAVAYEKAVSKTASLGLKRRFKR